MPDFSAFCLYCGMNLIDPKKPKKTTKKRSNGQGSVYKRSDLKERPWAAVAPKTKGEDGKNHRPVLGYFATEQEALAECMKFKNTPTEKINFTLKTIYDEWSKNAFKTIGFKTQESYTVAFKKLKVIQDTKIRDIRTPHLQKVIDTNEKLSRSSLSKIKILLSQLFDYATQEDIVSKNYAKFIVLPKAVKSDKVSFTDEEIKKIEESSGKIIGAELILALCYTGFRISEFFELTADSYNQQEQTLTGGKKTDAGRNRVVPIHTKIKSIVEKYAAIKGETLFCKDDGMPYTPNYFRKYQYYQALTDIGINRLTPHATRHTFLTRLSAAGARVEDMQALAGHEDYSVTANTYIHQDTDTLRKAIDLLN